MWILTLRFWRAHADSNTIASARLEGRVKFARVILSMELRAFNTPLGRLPGQQWRTKMVERVGRAAACSCTLLQHARTRTMAACTTSEHAVACPLYITSQPHESRTRHTLHATPHARKHRSSRSRHRHTKNTLA